jgi:hypothetical protein
LLLCEIPKSVIISIRKLFRSSSSEGDWTQLRVTQEI